jgi:hypothetical protein
MDTDNKTGNDEEDDPIIELTDVIEIRPEVNEFDDLGQDMADLGTLVSEITSQGLLPDMDIKEPKGTEGSTLSPAVLGAAVEKAVEKLFRDKIEARIMALFEATVKKEIEKISELIRDQARKAR